ncbi:class I adenylate-forming enzyme family protein [Halomarina litorea]|uniref:class I adenylate-forming enzyme family protein n=1 Tax=Halomarina litorea TaxID=2961595 RepID=UPI0020C483F1|nr:class I adenylate-forming enzyme family protein [Halomarina sp. BCD28]
MRRTHEYAAVQERLHPAMREAESMVDVLSTAAAEWPDRPYLTFAPTGETLTVGELDARAERVAGALAGLGVGRGDRVGLYLTNSPTYVVGIFACAKLGAVQVPVNWQYREREVRHAADTAGLSVVLADPDLEYLAILGSVAPDFDGLEHVVLADDAPDGFEGVSGAETHLLSDLPEAAVPTVSLEGDDPFAIMYTSGTTGLPKPALLTHRSYLLGGKSFLGAPFPEGDVNYNPFPLFHGNNQFYSMTGPLLAGTEWVLAERFTTSAFWDHVADNGVTSFNVLGGTPKMLDSAFDPEEVPDTDLELAIGPIGTELWEAFEEKFGLRVVQIYSQTESPTLLMNHPDPEQVRVGAIGMPMFPDLGHEVTLVDAGGNPVDPGEEGELTRTDPGAMAGYYEMPEKTAETLRDGRIFSGDVARTDEDGYCYYVDRKKFMIRRSGENIAPREIEDVVDELPGVEESAVIPVPDEVRGEEIKALVKRVDGGVTERDVVEQVAAHLAAYKVPRYVEFVDSFPKTPSERIQRTKLAEAERERADHGWDREA